MNVRKLFAAHIVVFAAFLALPVLATQPPQDAKKEFEKKEFDKKGFGPGGFGGPMMGQRRKLVAQFDKDGDGRLNTEERATAREAIKKDRASGKGGFGPGPKGKGPGGFGPGTFLTRPLLEALDADKDEQVTKAEFVAGVKKFFAESDKDKKGALAETQVAEAINRLLPRPQGFPGGPGGFGPPGFGGPGGFGPPPKDGPKDGPKEGSKGPPPGGGFVMFGPGNMFANMIVKRADADQDGKVTLDELVKAADAFYAECDKNKKGKLDEPAISAGIGQLMPAPPGFGGPGGFGKARDPAKPGPKVTPADVKSYPDAQLYDTSILRTVFVEFDNKKDWEAELADFYRTDVEVPATVTVDGKKYPNVGVHFRGNSSYFIAPTGYKHSLNLSFNFADKKQRLHGYRTLNLLNGADDPTLMHTVLFSHIARQYIPAPKANFVKVVINGESWGVFPSVQQFNSDFLKENYKSTAGARWRVSGQPGASGAGLSYLGENIEDYRRHYQIKSADNEKEWKALIALCRTLDKAPLDKLEEALKPMLDIDGVLWFLAIDNAVINDDGYWTRASDYSLYRDRKGVFHVIPHDTNETFTPMHFGFGGPMGGLAFGKGPKGGEFEKRPPDGGFEKKPKVGEFGGPKGGPGAGYALDPLSGLNDARMPLRSRLLQVPSLRAKYLKNLQTIARDSLDWKKIKPVVDQYRTLIDREVAIDTRKLYALDDYRNALADAITPGTAARFNLRAFFDGRHSYLMNHSEVKKAGS